MKDDWRTHSDAWIDAVLDSRGHRRAGPTEVIHVRPWSAVTKVPTSAGEAFFKACAPALGHEPALASFLAERWPEDFLEVWGVDEARGWMLTRGEAETLRSKGTGEAGLRLWEEMLGAFARVQIESAPLADEMVALGCPDCRLDRLPLLFEALMADKWMFSKGEDGLNEAELTELEACGGLVRASCEALAGFGVPEGLHHDDLHDGNVFWRDGGFVFFDWGDCSVAHPFFEGVVSLRVVAHRFEMKPGDDGMRAMREAYLAPWRAALPGVDVDEAFEIAQPLGRLCRALTWWRIARSPGGESEVESVAWWGRLLLEAFKAR